MTSLRRKYDLKPLVIHANYLINAAAINPEFLSEIRVMRFGRRSSGRWPYAPTTSVLHPGSFRGLTREEGLVRVVESITAAADGLDLKKGGLTILIENTAGAEFSLGGSFEQVGVLIAASGEARFPSARASIPVTPMLLDTT